MKNNKGSALVIVLMMSMVLIFLMSVGGLLIVTSMKETEIHQNVLTQADNIARAGLTDAISWFKRQSVQPVKSGVPPTTYSYIDGAFDPKYNANPLLSDTIDESIGIVKEYPLSESGLTWVRYEVPRQKDTATNPYDIHAVHDISSQRIDGRDDGEGWIWYIESIGYVYRRLNPSLAFDQIPNKVLAKVRASTEIRRVTLIPPAESAAVVYQSGKKNQEKILIRSNGKVIAPDGFSAISWYLGSAPPKIYKDGVVSVPQFGNCGDFSVDSVFSVPKTDLELLSDVVVTDAAQLPASLPDMIFIYVKGDATFTDVNPLSGSGLLFVDGDLHITQNSNSVFTGFIFVTGEAVIDEPSVISGMIVSNDKFELSNSSAVNVAQVEYNPVIVNNVRTIICNYRENKSTLHVFIGIPGLE